MAQICLFAQIRKIKIEVAGSLIENLSDADNKARSYTKVHLSLKHITVKLTTKY